MYVGMAFEIEVKTSGEGIAQRTHARIETRVFRTCQPWDFERVVESILIEHLLTVKFRRTTESENEVFLDAPKVVFRLSVCKTKHSARVRAAEDMRNAVRVAIDRDVAGERIRLCEEKSLKGHEDADSESKSSNHLRNY